MDKNIILDVGNSVTQVPFFGKRNFEKILIKRYGDLENYNLLEKEIKGITRNRYDRKRKAGKTGVKLTKDTLDIITKCGH